MKHFTCGLVTAALTVSLLALPAASVEFSDIQGHWGQTSMEQVAQWGLFSGNEKGEFIPDATMTRGMFVAVMERTAKLLNVYQEPAHAEPFSDVKTSDYFASGAVWARAVGLVAGVGNNQLAPNDPITREQMGAMMTRFLEKCAGMDLASYTQAGNTFLDRRAISAFAAESVDVCVALGLIQGVPVSGGMEFQPQASATRAAVAVVLERLVDVAGQQENPYETPQPSASQEPTATPQPTASQQPGAGGGEAGGGQTPPETQEPTEEEKAEEAKVAEYLQIIVENHKSQGYKPGTSQEVKDCMDILMSCIEDALVQRENGQFLDRAYIRDRYADQIAQLRVAYDSLTEEQLNEINNIIVRLAESEQIYFVMDYFGVAMGS